MLNLPGYDQLMEMPSRPGLKCYRGRQVKTGCPVDIHFIPGLNHGAPDADGLYARLLHLNRLRPAHLPRIYAVEKQAGANGSGILLILERPGGISIAEYCRANGPVAVKDFLDLALQLADGLGALHQAGLIHGALSSRKVVIDTESGFVTIAGMVAGMSRSAAAAPDNGSGKAGAAFSLDDLPYMSPEQTGRINRGVDYRSDFYALGTLFYEILTGAPPFTAGEPLEIIHAHMARHPVSPSAIRPDIDESVSGIVMKLLAKSPEDRYQSSQGLKRDLDYCLQCLGPGGTIPGFRPGGSDIPEYFRLPDRMYGREIELDLLCDAYARITEGGIGIIMLAGYSGIGKSTLVGEFQKQVTAQGGYFISGKYDQFQQDIPYSAVIAAYQSLIHEVMKAPADRIGVLRQKLLSALGANAQVMADVIPEIENIIGKSPPVSELPPADAHHRFNLVFEKFIQVFAAPEHPLTLFIDDLQWADPAGLKLMEAFFAGTRTRYFNFIGAYRNNEITDSHPLFASLKTIRDRKIPLKTITLKPISENDVNKLIGDAVHENLPRVKMLGRIVHEKTRGNPFFVRQFLQSLYREGLLYYDYETGRWRWHIERIAGARITDNVVDFMAEKVLQLTDAARHILQLAACIGNRFDMALLSSLAEKPFAQIAADLHEPVEMGFIVSREDIHRLYTRFSIHHPAGEGQGDDNEEAGDFVLEFLHDKIRQAVYSLIPEDHKNALHLKIGYLLLTGTDPDAVQNRIFTIVSHLNQGRGLITDPDQRLQLAKLNLAAGKKARDSAAYAQSLDYFIIGEQLLPDASWDENYDVLFALKQRRMECEYLRLNFSAAEEIFDVLQKRAATDEDLAGAFNQKMIMLASLARHDEALSIGLAGLKRLGIRLPGRAGGADVLKCMLMLKLKMRGKNAEDLMGMPPITDGRLLMILKMLSNLSFSAFLCKPYLAFVLTLKIFELTLKHGNSALSPFGYLTYGVSLCAIFKDYPAGMRFGKLALSANERYGTPEMTAKLYLYFGAGISVWVSPVCQAVSYNRQGIRSALDTGDINYAIYHIQSLVINLMVSGTGLTEIERECTRYFEFVEQAKDSGALNYLITTRQFIRALTGKTEQPALFNDSAFSEADHIKKMEHDDIRAILYRHYLMKLRLQVIMGRPAEALRTARRCRRYLHYHMGTIVVPEYYFYCAIALADAADLASSAAKIGYVHKIKRLAAKLAPLSVSCPENFEHKHLLIRAEIARLSGSPLHAIDIYQQAVTSAHSNGFTHCHALACERAAMFFLKMGLDKMAAPLADTARREYRAWGASAKVEQVEAAFSGILPRQQGISGPAGMPNLDFETIVNSLQMISTEIVRTDLIERLMKIVTENAGARKAIFLSVKSERMYVDAQYALPDDHVRIYSAAPADSRFALFTPVINFVRRSGNYLVLEDALHSPEYGAHEYVRKYSPRSVLCLPVVGHGRQIAILYLENDLTPSVFTSDRIEVLRLLASQAAISMENARLYENVIQNEQELREISARSEEAAMRYQARLRALSSELSLTEERERRRIATELHDRIGHALAHAAMKLRQLKAEAPSPKLAENADDISVIIDQTITDTQSLTFELSPPILYDLGLEAAIDWLIEQTQKQHGIRIDFFDDDTPRSIEESLRVLLFQATRELLFNMVKHARSTAASVSISNEENHIRIVIADNGIGFDASANKKEIRKGGFGLFSIRERLKNLGGRLEIKSTPDMGSRVTIIAPISSRPEGEI